MRKLISIVIATITMLGGSLALASPSAQAATVATSYALGNGGYGTYVNTGVLDGKSLFTAQAAIGCTNKAGLSRDNSVAFAEVPGVGTVSGVRTTTSTTKSGGTVASTARNTIAELRIGSASLGSLVIKGITAWSRSWHDGTGFHSDRTAKIASITLNPAIGDPQALEVPAPGETLEVPGLASITLGKFTKSVGTNGARSSAEALVIKVLATGSQAHVGHANSSIDGGITQGVFEGSSYAVEAKALDDLIVAGRNPFLGMPCFGTRGEVVKRALASVNVGGGVVVGAATSEQMAKSTSTSATGYEKSTVAKVNIGGGQVVVTGIVGRANATRTSSGLSANANGTRIGELTINGQTQTFPDTGVLEIPGLVKLERSVITRTTNGLKVTSLRITLLDGTGAVINLGNANFSIRPSGL